MREDQGSVRFHKPEQAGSIPAPATILVSVVIAAVPPVLGRTNADSRVSYSIDREIDGIAF